VVGPALASSPA